MKLTTVRAHDGSGGLRDVSNLDVHARLRRRIGDDSSVRFVLSSHDGFGLGHLRRNSLIAAALLEACPQAEITIVTGVPVRPGWLDDPRVRVVKFPALLKDAEGAYRNEAMSFDSAIALRMRLFRELIDEERPNVVLIDRHPYGTAGELRPGVEAARRQGAEIVIGLRDVLDERERVRAELAGAGWTDVVTNFSRLLVYGDRALCDHEEEYDVPLEPYYCGWVCEPPPTDGIVEPRRLVVAAGGGGDGGAVFRMGAELIRRRPDWKGTLVAGPYATDVRNIVACSGVDSRLTIVRDAVGCLPLFATAGAVLQMAGYNSTVESLAVGARPILVPRRSPRREQAIRACRLASLGLADVVDEGADAAEIGWLLDRPRQNPSWALERAGFGLDGAAKAAAELLALAGARSAA